MATLNPKEEIVFLLRGYFSCPLISFLGKRGVLDKMIDNEFSINEFNEVLNKDTFRAIITYFESVGLLEKGCKTDYYRTTEIGKKILKRYGSFCLLHSYGNFLNLLEEILFDNGYKGTPMVDRVENVIGSGQTNSRKYFPNAIEMLKNGGYPSKVIDVGCGNGAFLKQVLKSFPNCHVVAVDVSEKALEQTGKNLKTSFNNINLKTILSDGNEVSRWLKESIDADDYKETGSLIISMWYFIHEISKKDKNKVVNFLKEIYEIAPLAEIIIGEIISIPIEILVKNKYESIMPEFLFFHEISGQGVLSWQEYREILEKSPYKLKDEEYFDVLKYDSGETPSGFIWYLTPKR